MRPPYPLQLDLYSLIFQAANRAAEKSALSAFSGMPECGCTLNAQPGEGNMRETTEVFNAAMELITRHEGYAPFPKPDAKNTIEGRLRNQPEYAGDLAVRGDLPSRKRHNPPHGLFQQLSLFSRGSHLTARSR